MKRKKLVIAAGAAVLIAGVGIWFANRAVPERERSVADAPPAGAVNPEQSTSAMKSQPAPQLSDERFQPPPTIATGTFRDPEAQKPSGSQAKTAPR